MLFQALIVQRISLLGWERHVGNDLELRMREEERELWRIFKIFAKYHHIDVNVVARNKKKKVKKCDR
jgi:hypothetical protein